MTLERIYNQMRDDHINSVKTSESEEKKQARQVRSSLESVESVPAMAWITMWFFGVIITDYFVFPSVD